MENVSGQTPTQGVQQVNFQARRYPTPPSATNPIEMKEDGDAKLKKALLCLGAAAVAGVLIYKGVKSDKGQELINKVSKGGEKSEITGKLDDVFKAGSKEATADKAIKMGDEVIAKAPDISKEARYAVSDGQAYLKEFENVVDCNGQLLPNVTGFSVANGQNGAKIITKEGSNLSAKFENGAISNIRSKGDSVTQYVFNNGAITSIQEGYKSSGKGADKIRECTRMFVGDPSKDLKVLTNVKANNTAAQEVATQGADAIKDFASRLEYKGNDVEKFINKSGKNTLTMNFEKNALKDFSTVVTTGEGANLKTATEVYTVKDKKPTALTNAEGKKFNYDDKTKKFVEIKPAPSTP